MHDGLSESERLLVAHIRSHRNGQGYPLRSYYTLLPFTHLLDGCNSVKNDDTRVEKLLIETNDFQRFQLPFFRLFDRLIASSSKTLSLQKTRDQPIAFLVQHNKGMHTSLLMNPGTLKRI